MGCRVVWWFTDGKPGHENQGRGLIRALGNHFTLTIHEIPATAVRLPWLQWLTSRFSAGEGLPSPDYIIGAGHATHLPMLAARRARGGRVVVLMKPSLPISLFDLAIVPKHDGLAASETVLLTHGVLNNVVSGAARDLDKGLILIGGPSKNYGWSDDQMLAQVFEIVTSAPGVNWVLTSSRRTPSVFLPLLRSRELENLEVLSHEQTGSDWLPQQLTCADRVWVSEDSVSMVYEALTSGSPVGLLSVPQLVEGRVSVGIGALKKCGMVTGYSAWQECGTLRENSDPFNEAERCAEWIFSKWSCK
ncbi:hypothetical protein BOW53_03370 [Solemya pervernicosa gill symbiont]|uniref:Nucleoside-diphosphate sugar epimerase n=2 Tax=Gammaproteobacteria incertae sedis TaxID=118884 RepID=A0A1T2L956_9GAMM|nr:hypothetical protein BOW53_03370 [Solemya pervernicosa gill symbiont]QKQ28350.1 mitochondrial fission ELM1 family protein [Candidatus Reidiella endopervernicosa]